MSRLSFVVCAALLSACGQGFDPFVLQAKTSALCQSIENQQFQVPSDVRAEFEKLPVEMRQHVAISRTFAFDVGATVPAELDSKLTAEVKLTSITVSAIESSASLGFVDSAKVTLVPPAGSALTQQVFEWTRTEAEPRKISWAGEGFDVLPYLQAGALTYEVTMVGTLPSGDVSVNVDSCAAAALQLDYM